MIGGEAIRAAQILRRAHIWRGRLVGFRGSSATHGGILAWTGLLQSVLHQVGDRRSEDLAVRLDDTVRVPVGHLQQWATRISWRDRKVYLGMTRDAIKGSPKWTATLPIAREYEELLHRHYVGVAPFGSGAPEPIRARASPATWLEGA